MEAPFMDDLLDFASDCENDEERLQNGAVRGNSNIKPRKSSSFTPTALGSALLTVLHHPDDPSRPFADSTFVEEELEWISNKDAFPALETFPDFLSNHEMFLPAKQNSPVSVLETPTIPTSIATTSNSGSGSSSGSGGSGSIVTNCCGGLGVPVKARSKRRTPPQQCTWLKCRDMFVKRAEPGVSSRVVGRKCQHCGVEKTPQWRAGPLGAKSLCNACGVRFKSGRLVAEYRPANSPTFCSELHSNSHKKVVEMRRQKEMMGLTVVKPMDKGVG